MQRKAAATPPFLFISPGPPLARCLESPLLFLRQPFSLVRVVIHHGLAPKPLCRRPLDSDAPRFVIPASQMFSETAAAQQFGQRHP